MAGIEAVEPGYRTFAVKPLVGGGITWARAHVDTPYGKASVEWKTEGGVFTVTVRVPVGTACRLTLPDGSARDLASGVHTASCAL